MYPYTSQTYTQAYAGNVPALPGQVPPQQTTDHVQSVMKRNQLIDRLRNIRTSKSVIPSVIACILVQAVAAFFYITSFLTFSAVIQNADDFSDDPNDDTYTVYLVFNVFLAIASALCAPMIQNSGYNVIIMAGTVLMLFSTMSSSLVSSADILVIPYSVFGACAYGLLKVGPQVAMLDYLNNRRGLAAGLSYLGVTIGQLAGVFSYVFTDMVEDASYDGSGKARWPNNLRIIEVTAVVSLMAAAVLRKPSFATGSWPELFHYVPFYFLTILYFLINIGFRFLDDIAGKAPDERDFDAVLEESAILTPAFIGYMAELAGIVIVLVIIGRGCGECCRIKPVLIAALATAILSAGSFINEVAYEEFWTFSFYTGCAGFIKAIVRTCVPLAMIFYTGRENYKIGLPFLELAGGLGQLIGYIVLIEAPSDTSLEVEWYVTASLFGVVALGGFIMHCQYRSWEAYKAGEDEGEANRIHAIENAAFEPDIPDYDE